MSGRALVLAMLAAALPAQERSAVEPVWFVRDGVPLAIVERGGAWQREDGALVGHGLDRFLDAAQVAGTGDVTIVARVALASLDGTAASLVLGDGNHFGFDGRQRTPFVEGPWFGGLTLLDAPTPPLAAGRPFTVEVVRRGTRLELRLDGAVVHTATIAADVALGRIALRPWRATLRVLEFRATGDLVVPPPSITAGAPFRSGDGGYDTYRIPATAVVGDTLLLFCEGRRTGRGDSGDIDVVLRRSTDGGRTFAPLQVVWDDAGNTCGNPCPVVDAATGTVWLLLTWNRGDDHERAIIARESHDTRRVFVTHSTDRGATWAAPTEITSDVKADDWTWYATGPGNGIQLSHAAHAGRLVVPCDHIEATTRAYRSHCILSDDGGKTWRCGAAAPHPAVNECAVAELSDGRLLLNMRNYDRAQHTRQIAWSDDGGETWRDQRHDSALVEPICQASLVRASRPQGDAGPATLLFANPADPGNRARLTVRRSDDDGATWGAAVVLHAGPSAYSSLAILGDGTARCAFEAGDAHPYEAIVVREVRFR